MLCATYSVMPFDRQSARLLAEGAAPDAVGHHRQEGEPLRRRPVAGVGQAGAVNRHLSPEGADQEMILVGLPDASDVGQPEDVDLVIPRLPVGGHFRRRRGRYAHDLPPREGRPRSGHGVGAGWTAPCPIVRARNRSPTSWIIRKLSKLYAAPWRPGG